MPLARANEKDRLTLARAIAGKKLSSRQVGELYVAWKVADAPERKRIVENPDVLEAFDDPFHPVASGGELTLAWSRIDLDLDRGEALVEEIQSDWVRDAQSQSRWEIRR